MSQLMIFCIKIWRITCANALALSGGLSLLIFVEKHVHTWALVMTSVSFVIFYVVAYQQFGELEPALADEAFSWQVFVRRITKITLVNALVIVAGVTYLLFVTGLQMCYLSLLTVVSFVLHYIDEYQRLRRTEALK